MGGQSVLSYESIYIKKHENYRCITPEKLPDSTNVVVWIRDRRDVDSITIKPSVRIIMAN